MEPRHTAEDAVELGAQVAELAKAGLPLAPGLRALAAELPRRRVAEMLHRVADRLDAGIALDAALEAEGSRFPRHIRGILAAGIRTGHLGEALEEFVALERVRIELRRRIRLSLAYPTLLIGITLAIVAFVGLVVALHFWKIFQDFGTNLPVVTKAFFWTINRGVWNGLALLAVALLLVAVLRATGRPIWLQRFLYAIPIIGPLWRWQGLYDFSRLMGLLIDQQVPTPEAFRLCSAGMRQADLRQACLDAAGRAEAGLALAENFDQSPSFPPSLRAAIRWTEPSRNLGEAFHTAAELFEGRVRAYAKLHETVATPIAFAFVVGFIGFMIVALFMPLIRLISVLS